LELGVSEYNFLLGLFLAVAAVSLLISTVLKRGG